MESELHYCTFFIQTILFTGFRNELSELPAWMNMKSSRLAIFMSGEGKVRTWSSVQGVKSLDLLEHSVTNHPVSINHTGTLFLYY